MTIKNTSENNKPNDVKMTCGIIMPIAPHPDYPQDHWKDVLNILTEAINQTEFEPKLVSDDVAIGLIHDRIVTNIYNNEIVVCDVSSKNPNVMFELGLRLAFDKPTIIIKDETTGYSFDTGVIEHISYPSSLRFSQIVKFKEELIRRINATYKKSKDEPNYSPFLKSFGKTIVPATFQQTEIPEGKFILSQLELMSRELQMLRFEQRRQVNIKNTDNYLLNESEKSQLISSIIKHYFSGHSDMTSVDFENLHKIIRDELSARGYPLSRGEIRDYINNYLNSYSITNNKE